MSELPGGPDERPQLRTSKDLDDKIARARAVVNALERSLRSRRLYEADHPLRQESLTELGARFEEFFDRYSYLRLDVTDAELRLAGKPLMKCTAREPEVPFRMYKDGIREIRFHRGISKQEILDFLSILDIPSKQLADLDLDLVSLLWANDFKAIDQITVDEIETIEAESALPSDREAARGERSLAGDLFGLLRAVSSLVPGSRPGGGPGGASGGGPEKGSPRAASPSASVGHSPVGLEGQLAETTIPEVQVPTPYRDPETGPTLTETELESIFLAPLDEGLRDFREEVERETLGAVIERTLEILTDIFSSTQAVLADEVRPLLRGLVGFHVRKGDFARLGHLLKRLEEKRLLGRVVGGEVLWKDLLEDIQGPDARKLFLTYLNTAFAGDVDGLKHYFTFVDTALVQDACASYGQIKSARARAPVKEYLIAQGRKTPSLLKGLLLSPEAVLPEAFEIYRQVNPPALALELESVFGQLSRALKLDGLSIVAKTEGIGRIRLFGKALGDPDSAVRAQALKLMGDLRSAEFRRPVQDWIEAKEFAARTPGERILAYCTLSRIAGAAGIPFLKELAERKPSLFNSQKDGEARRILVQAISTLDTTEGRRLLEDWAATGDRQLKDFATQAIKLRG
ncbi:MAG TPA: HEAT repeat domain-containing protein [Planctomycetota bacterium]|nr:HEAT repeat domain-containing protein [Planctomycetota bacterium]